MRQVNEKANIELNAFVYADVVSSPNRLFCDVRLLT